MLQQRPRERGEQAPKIALEWRIFISSFIVVVKIEQVQTSEGLTAALVLTMAQPKGLLHITRFCLECLPFCSLECLPSRVFLPFLHNALRKPVCYISQAKKPTVVWGFLQFFAGFPQFFASSVHANLSLWSAEGCTRVHIPIWANAGANRSCVETKHVLT